MGFHKVGEEINKYCQNISFIVSDGPNFLTFQKGDLIVLDQHSGENVMNSGWCSGENMRSGNKGDFPAECVYVLPTITRPPEEILVRVQIKNCF